MRACSRKSATAKVDLGGSQWCLLRVDAVVHLGHWYQYRQIRISTAFQSGMPRHCRIRAPAPGTSPGIELHQLAQRKSIAVLLLAVGTPSKACTSSRPLGIYGQCTVAATIEFVLARGTANTDNNVIA